jgi:hypothetical protein
MGTIPGNNEELHQSKIYRILRNPHVWPQIFAGTTENCGILWNFGCGVLFFSIAELNELGKFRTKVSWQ